MPKTVNHEDEAARLRSLARQRLLDTPSEEAFDRIARIAASAYDTPIAAVSLVDRDRQWFKSRIGLDTCSTSRDAAFCHHTIKTPRPLVIPDAAHHPLVWDNPLVTGAPGIRAYLGAPVRSPDGFHIGSLCVIDTRPRPDFALGRTPLIADLAEIVTREIEVREVSQTDELTGLASRRHFLAELAREAGRAVRYGRPLSVGYLDIDHFKHINDSFGHLVGDEVLRGMASRLAARLRGQDVLGRLGGEEFGLLLPETGEAPAAIIAERLRESLSAEPIPTCEGPVRITISIGLSTAPPGIEPGEWMIAEADRNLYRAKAAGRDCVSASDAAGDTARGPRIILPAGEEASVAAQFPQPDLRRAAG